MAIRKRYITIPVDPDYFPFLKELKVRYASLLGREVTWSAFLKWLCDSVFGERETGGTAVWNLELAKDPDEGTNAEGEVQSVEMRQPELGGVERTMADEELDAWGVRQDDVQAVEMARMTLSSVFISERSCQRIAEILFEKAKGQT